MVARDREHRRAEPAQQFCRPLVLRPASPVGEVAGGDDELRLDPFHELREGALDLRLLACTCVQVGDMEEARGHDRSRL